MLIAPSSNVAPAPVSVALTPNFEMLGAAHARLPFGEHGAFSVGRWESEKGAFMKNAANECPASPEASSAFGIRMAQCRAHPSAHPHGCARMEHHMGRLETMDVVHDQRYQIRLHRNGICLSSFKTIAQCRLTL
jgi:hypothetical protein